MKKKTSESLTPEQKKAVQFGNGPCLVVAGAGTGKTRVITYRIAELVKKGVPANKLLALTFTEKAALEMQERVDQLLPLGTNHSTITTFHSFTTELLRRYAHFLGIPGDFSLLSQEEELVFLQENLYELPLKILRPSNNPTKFLTAIISYFNRLRDEAISSQELSVAASQTVIEEADNIEAEIDQRAIWQELSEALSVYDQLLKDNGYLTFGHCITEVLNLFKVRPSVLKEVQNEYSYLMVDEYQDTNWAQTELAAQIAGRLANLMAVGDDDQAIYRFRGAASANIRQFLDRFPKAELIVLTQNYRSTQEILDTAYRGIQHNNPNRLEYSSQINKRLIGQRSGPLPEFQLFDRLSSELLGINNQVQQWLEEGIAPQEIAVLTRARSHANKITFSLKQAGIPVNNPSAYNLYDHPLIAGLLAFGQLLLDQNDNLAFIGALSSPLFNLKASHLNSLAEHRPYREEALFSFGRSVIEQQPAWFDQSALKLLQKFYRLHKKLVEYVNERPSLTLLNIIHQSGLYGKLTKRNKPESLIDLERLGQLFEEAQAFEERHRRTSWRLFRQYLEVLIENEINSTSKSNSDIDPFMVNVLTIHQSKGLEYEAVIIAHLSEGRFPSRERREMFDLPQNLMRDRLGDSTHEEEERRLFYVAVTRAKSKLLCTAANHYGASNRKSKISRFVYESFGESQITASQPTALPATDYLQMPLELEEQSPDLTKREISTITISQTDLDTYIACPYKYRYKSLLKIKPHPSAVMNFGISMHNALRAYFDERNRGNNVPITELLDKYWVSGGYESKKQEKERLLEGKEALTKMDHELSSIKPDRLEWSFTFPLPSGDRLRGRIDRLDRHPDGTVSIIDYKTGNPKEESQARKDLQLGVYIMALESSGREKVKDVTLSYITHQKKVTVSKEDFALAKIHDQIESSVSNLKKDLTNDNFKAKPDKIKCQYCEFKSLCPFRYTE